MRANSAMHACFDPVHKDHYTIEPKIFKVENFHGFRGSENGREKFLPRNFNFITDARRGWKLDHENLFLSRNWQNRETFNPQKF